jgi:hypothetical protein
MRRGTTCSPKAGISAKIAPTRPAKTRKPASTAACASDVASAASASKRSAPSSRDLADQRRARLHPDLLEG